MEEVRDKHNTWLVRALWDLWHCSPAVPGVSRTVPSWWGGVGPSEQTSTCRGLHTQLHACTRFQTHAPAYMQFCQWHQQNQHMQTCTFTFHRQLVHRTVRRHPTGTHATSSLSVRTHFTKKIKTNVCRQPASRWWITPIVIVWPALPPDWLRGCFLSHKTVPRYDTSTEKHQNGFGHNFEHFNLPWLCSRHWFRDQTLIFLKLKHGVSNAKVMGSILREYMTTCIPQMQVALDESIAKCMKFGMIY